MLAFVIGGTVGGFVVLFAALHLFSSEESSSGILVKALQWSVAGGVLGATAWAIAPLAGGIDHSLFLVWESGMGLTLGLLFALGGRDLRASLNHRQRTVPRNATWRIARILRAAGWQIVTEYLDVGISGAKDSRAANFSCQFWCGLLLTFRAVRQSLRVARARGGRRPKKEK